MTPSDIFVLVSFVVSGVLLYMAYRNTKKRGGTLQIFVTIILLIVAGLNGLILG